MVWIYLFAQQKDVKMQTDKHERTLICFTDEATMKQNMPQKGVRIPTAKVCPVTRLPAKYFDPVTQLPYANLQAFKIIREAYYQQLETKGTEQ